MKKFVALAVIALLVSMSAYTFFQRAEPLAEQATAVPLSERAVPNEALTTLHHEQAQLHDYIGKPTVLVFWATWCIPCNEELPEIQAFYEQFHDSVNVLAINATHTEASVEAVQQHVQQKQWTFPIFIDETKQVSQTFGAFTVPTTVILTADGEIAHEVYGPVDGAYIESIIATL